MLKRAAFLVAMLGLLLFLSSHVVSKDLLIELPLAKECGGLSCENNKGNAKGRLKFTFPMIVKKRLGQLCGDKLVYLRADPFARAKSANL